MESLISPIYTLKYYTRIQQLISCGILKLKICSKCHLPDLAANIDPICSICECNNNEPPILTFKVVIAGNGGVGKTSILKKMMNNKFERKYIPTLGVEVHPVRFNTNYGPICFNIWDVAGDPKFSGLGDGYFIKSDGAILVYDNNETFQNTESWANMIKRMSAEDIPMVLVRNKTDINTPQEGEAYMFSPIYVSAETGKNIKEPFISLACKLTGHNDLEFTD